MTIKKQPQIRFGGFGGDWEWIELGQNVEFFSGLTYSPNDVQNSGTLVLRSSNVQNGEIFLNDNVFVNNECVNSQNVEVDDIIVVVRNGSRNLIGKHAIIKKEMPNTVIGAFMTGVKADDANFYNALFDTNQFEFEVNKNLGATINQITTGTFKKMEFYVPEKPEQIAIGQFFRQLDEMLTLAVQKHAQTVQLKKALLGKLFPISGSLQPQIRLKGFSGDWVERKLGDLGECMSGIGFPENEQGGKSGIPFYKVSDMNLPENNIFLKTANNFVTDEQIQQNNWKVITSVPCIFFAKVGAALLLNRKRLVTTPFLLDNNTMAFVIGLELHDYFAKILFDNIDLPKISQVGALPSINAKDVENIIVRLPETLAEQTAIGKLFQTLDHTIALQAKEITQIKQLKSALLGKMFV